MVITSEIAHLVYKIEQGTAFPQEFEELVHLLADRLSKRLPANRATPKLGTRYPVIAGYAESVDPLEDENKLMDYWHTYGLVVGRQVVQPDVCRKSVKAVQDICRSQGMNLREPQTYKKDETGVPILSRGFLEVYQHQMLLELRQSVRLYVHHALLWGSPYLWTTFDRLGVKVPGTEEAAGLPLHVDQNPTVHPEFRTMQGVIALEDCPAERGTFVAVPGSAPLFKEYAKLVDPGYVGEYVPLNRESPLHNTLVPFAQVIPLKQGDIVTWDSRTTHANSDNVSDQVRYVAYVSTGIANPERSDLVAARVAAYKHATGENKRDAYLHASKKPRFTDPRIAGDIRGEENMTPLGAWLYGLLTYPKKAGL